MRIAILTSGGDAPGMNTVVLDLVNIALKEKHEVFLVENGYEGLLNNNFTQVKNSSLYQGYLYQAGSFIYCARSQRYVNEYELAIKNLESNKIDYLIVIGGNGSYKGVQLITSKIKTIFIPASIDNDIDFSDYSIGFSSAVNEIVDQSKKLISTFKTHKNIILLEVFGRHCSNLAIHSSAIINPALTLTHENKLSKDEIINKLKDYYKENEYALVIISEYVYSKEEINEIMNGINNNIPCQSRFSILGYSQRGAIPNAYELFMASQFAKLAIEQIDNGNFNIAIFYKNNNFHFDKYDKLFTR